MHDLSHGQSFVKIPQNISNSSNFGPPLFQKCLVDRIETSTLHICNLELYSFTGKSLRTLEQKGYATIPRTNYCISNVNRRTDGQTELGIAIALSQIGWLGAENYSRYVLLM